MAKKAIKKAAKPRRSVSTAAKATPRPAKKVVRRKPAPVATKKPKPASRPSKTEKPVAKPTKVVARPEKTPAKPEKKPVAAEKPVVRVEPSPAPIAIPEKVVPPVPVAQQTDLGQDSSLLNAPRKGVRKATLTTGLREASDANKLGRSRIPVDAPLDVVFQSDPEARDAFHFLGIHSIRELEQFSADQLVLRLTSPAKLTVGRIRKKLAMNNRCLAGDEDFAQQFHEVKPKTE